MTIEPLKLPTLLRDYGVRPKKSLGQNFLVDDVYLRRIVEAAGISPQTDVLEVGAGAGSLTRYLAQAGSLVTAVEIDRDLIPLLTNTVSSFKNVRIIRGDILEQDSAALMLSPGYAVVANIPYYITSALIRFLLESPSKPSRMVLTIQQEVAQRVCAHAGDLSLLALSVQVYGTPSIAFHVPARAFYPVPGVDSSVLIVELFDVPGIPSTQIDDFFALAKAAFSQKRKMLRNTLISAPGLDKNTAARILEHVGIDPQRRAQMLTLEEWKALTAAYQKLLESNS